MKKLKQKLILILTAIILILGWGLAGIMTSFFHMELFQAFAYIPVQFFLNGLLTITLLLSTDITNDKKITNLYMLLKLLKFIFIGVLAFVYLYFLKVDKSSFIIVVGVFYLFYIAFETYTFMSFEKEIKKIKHEQ
jgi:hypothetical protein